MIHKSLQTLVIFIGVFCALALELLGLPQVQHNKQHRLLHKKHNKQLNRLLKKLQKQ